MKCMNCEIQIPSEWQACINSNICPKCGKSIMDAGTQLLLNEFSSVFSKLEAAPPEIMSLVLSNFNLKIIKHDDLGSPDNLKTIENPVHQWLKRSNAPHLANRQNKIRDLLEQIKAAEDEVDVENEEDFHQQALYNNSLTDSEDVLPPTSEEREELQNLFENVPQEVLPDTELHPVLQADRIRRLMKSRAVASGEGGGAFRRNG